MNKHEWILYCRSFLLTMGGSLVLFSFWFAVVNCIRNEFMALPPISIFIAFNIIGGLLVHYGICSNDKKVDSMANSASKHWTSLIVMLVAYPVYLVLSSKRKPNA
jgi:hypothetical protein